MYYNTYRLLNYLNINLKNFLIKEKATKGNIIDNIKTKKDKDIIIEDLNRVLLYINKNTNKIIIKLIIKLLITYR